MPSNLVGDSARPPGGPTPSERHEPNSIDTCRTPDHVLQFAPEQQRGNKEFMLLAIAEIGTSGAFLPQTAFAFSPSII